MWEEVWEEGGVLRGVWEEGDMEGGEVGYSLIIHIIVWRWQGEVLSVLSPVLPSSIPTSSVGLGRRVSGQV